MTKTRILIALVVTCTGLAAESDVLTIKYTGKLLGYARQPDVQRAVPWGWRVDGKVEQGSAEIEKKCKAGRAICQPMYKFVHGEGCSPAAAIIGSLVRDGQAAEFKCRGKSTHDGLLLGMGDNFAMDYFSRMVVVECPDKIRKFIPKDDLLFDAGSGAWIDLSEQRNDRTFAAIQEAQWAGNAAISDDNVATFFSTAGYDALVPGKHDFYFGPERLRQLASKLSEGGTQLLGANLVMQSKRADTPVEMDEFLRAKKRDFETKVDEMSWSLPKTVLPWMRSFRLSKYKNADGSSLVKLDERAELCVTNDRDHRSETDCLKMSAGTEHPERGEVVYRIEDKRPLLAERTYLVCAALRPPQDQQKKNKGRICAPVDVSSPFFQYPDRADEGFAGNQPTDKPNTGKLYVKPWATKDGVVVMGVVEPGLESYIGWLNASYINRRSEYETHVKAIDPAEALKQLIEYCVDTAVCSEATPLVLMAQMPRDEAAVLNDRLEGRFAVVIAQADRRFATPPLAYTQGSGPNRVVLVPREIVGTDPGEDESLTKGVQLHLATITGLRNRSAMRFTATTTRRIPIEWKEKPTISAITFAPPAGPGGRDCLSYAADAAWKRATGQGIAKEPDAVARFRTLVLHAMRDALHADVALIQERDFFEVKKKLEACPEVPDSTPGERMRAALEQILWKGDFAVSRTITGAALKAVLAESERLKNLGDSWYKVEVEDRRWLHQLGLWQDPDTKRWYVNGGALDDKTTYAVAMTDHLVSGDTGYVNLQDPAVAPRPRARNQGRLKRLSEVVWAKLTEAAPIDREGPTCLDHSSHQAFAPPSKARPSEESMDTGLDVFTYLDHSAHQPFVPAPEAMWWDQVRAIWHNFFQMRPNLGAAADRLGQTRPYWRLLVDKGEFGFSDYNHNKTTHDQLKAEFAGTSESGVLAAKTRSIPLSFQVELRRERVRSHVFSRSELDFSFSNTQKEGAAGRRLTTYPANKFSLESGYRSTFTGTMRSRPWIAWLLSAYAETNPHRPVTDGITAGVKECAPAESCPTALTFAASLPKTSRVLGKFGLRRENGQNWGEAGLFGGMVNRPTEYTVLQNGAPVATSTGACRLADLVVEGKPQTLNDCLQKAFLIAVATPDAQDDTRQTLDLRGKTGTKPESGLFFNFNYTIPVPNNWVIKELVFDQRGSWFFNDSHDTVLDARLIEKFSLGPTLTVAPNLPGLSLKPTYTLFFYRNKIVHNLLEGKAFDIKLEYRFDWKTGASWGQVMRYGRPK